MSRAEDATGLEFCVYVGPVTGEPRRHAEQIFADLGLADRPGVLLLVAPAERRFEIVVSRAADDRINERDLALAAATLRASFAVGDVAGGVCEGIRLLAQSAGPGDGTSQAELPDLIGL